MTDASNRSGGADLSGQSVTVGADVVGRDKDGLQKVCRMPHTQWRFTRACVPLRLKKRRLY